MYTFGLLGEKSLCQRYILGLPVAESKEAKLRSIRCNYSLLNISFLILKHLMFCLHLTLKNYFKVTCNNNHRLISFLFNCLQKQNVTDGLLEVCMGCVQGYLVVFSRKIKINCLVVFCYVFFFLSD